MVPPQGAGHHYEETPKDNAGGGGLYVGRQETRNTNDRHAVVNAQIREAGMLHNDLVEALLRVRRGYYVASLASRWQG